MKLFTLATAMLLAASFDTASAAECTAEQLLANANVGLTITSSKDCAAFNAGTQTAAQTCADTKCLEVIKKAIANLADCTKAGVDVKKTLSSAITSCSTSSTASATTSTTTTTTSAPVAAPVAASAATSTKTSMVGVTATSVLAVVAMRL